jgi:heterodisulfide reductase subunit C
MRSLKRLKNFLTGEEAEEKKDDKKSSESEMPETDKEEEEKAVKSETKQEATPTVEKNAKKAHVVEEKSAAKEVKAKPAVEKQTKKAKKTNVQEKSKPEVIKEAKKEEPQKGSVSMSLLNKEENLVRGEEVDPTFKQDIIDAGAETVALCYQCGTCTGSCPSGKRTPYRIRSIIRKSLMGLRSEVMEDETIWECVTCYACQERCPRGVAIVDVVKTIRNMQSQAGKMAQAHKMVGTFVLKTGHGVPINDATMELRKRVGLGKLPPTTHEYPEALEEVQNILKKTKFDSLIGYNWETGELE